VDYAFRCILVGRIERLPPPDELLVRARRRGDIERVFPNAKVSRSPKGDYLFRSVLPRSAVKSALAARIDDIRYDNFKDSVGDDDLHTAYTNVWFIMAELQPSPSFGTTIYNNRQRLVAHAKRLRR
jgi:hypothetical protein